MLLNVVDDGEVVDAGNDETQNSVVVDLVVIVVE